jgi:hypothetical protein
LLFRQLKTAAAASEMQFTSSAYNSAFFENRIFMTPRLGGSLALPKNAPVGLLPSHLPEAASKIVFSEHTQQWPYFGRDRFKPVRMR